MSERVVLERKGAVAHVRLNRPEKRNGLDLPMFRALIEVGRSLQSANDVRAVILSGEGKGFCAGLDWASFMMNPNSGTELLERPDDRVANLAQEVAWTWREAPMPVIAALHGFAVGGGLQIALGADIVYAAPDTKLSVMEVRYGLIPDMGITQTLLRNVRLDVAKELIFTARTFDAVEGAALGVITRVAEDPMAAALHTAEAIAMRSPHAVRAAKRLVEEAVGEPAKTLPFETELQMPLLGSANQMEAAGAVMMKRDPVFEDPS